MRNTNESVLVVDSKGLYDNNVRREVANKTVKSEKRTNVEIAMIKQILARLNGRVRWVNSDQQIVDGLTKESKCHDYMEILRRNRIRISFDPDFVSAKKKRAQARAATFRNRARKEEEERTNLA